ncbi:MAG: DUF1223 domain-containing protein [Rhodospirillales bacterium]|nr:DUF1223 domain-containing protein [Rhodospirillales bacterium]
MSGPAMAQDGALTVVELFTSQGCSSCPPADTYLGELAQRADVIALSFHVNYWDYIGWKDPYASQQSTDRQKAYARQMSLRYVYTPQMVVQGTYEGTGSDRGKIKRFINSAKSIAHVPIDVTVGQDTSLDISIMAKPYLYNSSDTFGVWVAVYDKEHATEVKRGENNGRLMKNYNVVRDLQRVGEWKGGTEDLRIPLAQLTSLGGDGCAVFIQSQSTGQILGAANYNL